ncbi:HLA class II histocompatibility antigen, DM beta chain-like [Hemicordylus capensis]|uniref:HLA class II histocompatibility antigen, DM beta chain-like n=1 Tax=Hemicordylus capensis TaxID=884348 RepID=UPI002304755E|nr:HLA class II histocompatibility antigen, DM beta chain-like [Hemicordylus capensis]
MRPTWLLLLLAWPLCLAQSPPPPDLYVLRMETDCILAANSQLLWAKWTLSFNKIPFVCYDNEDQEFLPCGLGATFPWNNTAVPICELLSKSAPHQRDMMRTACQQQSQPLWKQTGARLTPPKIRIYPVTPQNTPEPMMLACNVWGFYPKEVAISWLKNGVPVKDGSGTPVHFSNGDWTYQARVTLPVNPHVGDTYTCQVTHASLPEPMTKNWAPGMPMELRLRVGVALAVLLLGIAFLIAGIIFWRKRIPPRSQ